MDGCVAKLEGEIWVAIDHAKEADWTCEYSLNADGTITVLDIYQSR
jgi:hypothetical protein